MKPRTSLRLIVTLAVLSVLIVSLSPTVILAQTTDSVTCDSTLATLLILAARDYRFTSTLDLSGFNFGQYTAAAQTALNLATQSVDAAATQAVAGVAQANSAVDQAATQAASALDQVSGTVADAAAAQVADALGQTVEGVDAASTQAAAAIEQANQAIEGASVLLPGIVAGENTVCTALRAELDAFFLTLFNERE